MRRLLVVGKELANFPNTAWAGWMGANPLDYQGLILDCRRLDLLPSHAQIANTLQTYINNDHPVYAILPGAKEVESLKGALSFVPGINLYLGVAAGQTLQLKSPDPLFQSYIKVLDGHEINIQIHPGSNQRPAWTAGIVDNVSRPVCAKIFSIYLLHPPSAHFEQKAFKAIIEHFNPDVTTVSTLPKPGWVDEAAAKLSGVAEAESRRKSIQAEIDLKNETLRLQEDELRSLTAWTDLLWLDGVPLQAKVGEALNFLGISASSADPTGHTGDLVSQESGVQFVFEVTGSVGSIGIEKGRQLVQWTAEATDPLNAKGVLVGNAYRNDPPMSRPPTVNHKIFVTDLERYAQKFHLALLDVRELYRLVSLKLAGRTIEKNMLIQGLQTDGVVRFSVE
jgi:hypothetical protein